MPILTEALLISITSHHAQTEISVPWLPKANRKNAYGMKILLPVHEMKTNSQVWKINALKLHILGGITINGQSK
jgi:hypothetical protein